MLSNRDGLEESFAEERIDPEEIYGQLFCPFPRQPVTCSLEAVEEYSKVWIQELGLFPGHRGITASPGYGSFAALVHPDAADEDRLLLALENIVAAFGIDDHYCDEPADGADPRFSGARLAGVMDCLERGNSDPRLAEVEMRIKTDPVARALRHVIEHAARIGSPSQLGRLRREITAMCLAMAGEKCWQICNYTPSVAEYLAQRRFNGAISCLALIDLAGGYELPHDLYERDDVRSLTLAASNLIIHVNDLFSGRKEKTAGAGCYSLPAILSARYGCSADLAIHKTIEIHNQDMARYLTLEEAVSEDAPRELLSYLQGLRNWIRGSLEWHAVSGRHHGGPGRPAAHGSRQA